MNPTASLINWFQAHGGVFDTSALTFTAIDGQGYGALALRDLAEGHTLFTLPRDLTLSTRTSRLPALVGQEEWKKHHLDVGWAGLILSMMWEQSQGSASKWHPYLVSLPKSFDTPMFWGSEELDELKGTAVVEKIGRDRAETDYREKVLPLIQSRPDMFKPEHRNEHYTLESYHLMGSRILSRSFQVEKWKTGRKGDGVIDIEAHDGEVSMNVDEEPPAPGEQAEADDSADVEEPDVLVDDSDDSDDEEDPSDVAMVPMADMLNARFESENAKLFYEERDLRMAVTRPVSQGEQIWNTYGDLPNSDLLRRYGHVDLVHLPDGDTGNPADVVEVRADLAVVSITEILGHETTELAERVDWWLEEGGEDVFIFDSSGDLPDQLIAFIRLLGMNASEWEKLKLKMKLPKPKIDCNVLSTAVDVIRRRISEYPTTMENDKLELVAGNLSTNKRHSLIVRLGEKRILNSAAQKASQRLAVLSQSPVLKGKSGSKKRKLEGEDGQRETHAREQRRAKR